MSGVCDTTLVITINARLVCMWTDVVNVITGDGGAISTGRRNRYCEATETVQGKPPVHGSRKKERAWRGRKRAAELATVTELIAATMVDTDKLCRGKCAKEPAACIVKMKTGVVLDGKRFRGGSDVAAHV